MQLPLEDIVTYIDWHLCSIHDISDIARAFGVNGDALRRTFKKATGRTLGNYLRAKRIEHACWLLENTELRPNEVSRHVGWERPDSGSRAFKQEMGMSMQAYRITRNP